MSNYESQHILHCHPVIKEDVIKAENTSLFTRNGKKIIEFEADSWAMALGHNNPRINEVMMNQIKNTIHLSVKLIPSIAEELSLKLLELLNFKDGKSVFLSSGSEAVELGIRLSRLISDKKKAITFSGAYLSAYSSGTPRDKNSWIEINSSGCNNCSACECSHNCAVLKDLQTDNISTFVLEVGSGARVSFPPYKLVKFLAKLVKEQGGTIVVNEITTGFGRTGKWFGHNHYDLDPDIVALGKCLGNGYPISAVVMKKEIADQVEAKNFHYAQSHQNDPLGCAIANEVINIFKEDNMIARAKDISDFFISQLIEINNSCSIVKEILGRGLMLALELNVPKVTDIILEKMLEKGYMIGTTPSLNLLRFYPSITMSKEDISNMCLTLKKVLMEIEKNNY